MQIGQGERLLSSTRAKIGGQESIVAVSNQQKLYIVSLETMQLIKQTPLEY